MRKYIFSTIFKKIYFKISFKYFFFLPISVFMESKGKLIDKILKDFLTNEAQATDMRIMSIRHFLSTLNTAVDKYLEETSEENSERKRLVLMLDDMAEIYRNEVSELLVKRGKLQHYIEIFNKDNQSYEKRIISNTNKNSIYNGNIIN